MRIWLLGLFFLFCSFSSYAFWLNSVVERFSPVEAKIIAVEAERVFLDAGRVKGVEKNDIFSVYKPVKVLKTESGRPLVLWSGAVAKLKVVEVEDSYSVALVISGKTVKKGWKAVRFKDVSACFQGEGDKSETVEKMLKVYLNHMSWQGKPCDLLFKYTKAGYLDVITRDRIEIAFVPIFEVDFPHPAPQKPKNRRYTEGGSEIYLENYRDVATFPVYVLSADFGTIEGERGVKIPAVVYTNGRTVFFAYIMDYEPKVISRYEYKGSGDIIHVAAGDVDGDGNLEVVATAYDMDNGPVSFILKMDEKGHLKMFKDNIYYLLNLEDSDLDGTKDTILATGFDEQHLFEKRLYIMKLEGKKLKTVDKFSVPDVFKLYSCWWGDIDGDGNKELVFTTDTHKLAVYEGDNLWLSAESVGGGYNYVRLVKGGPSFNYEEAIFIDPDLVVFKVGKHVKILAIKNKSKHKFIIGNIPWYKGSEIMELVREFYGYSLVSVSEEVDGVIQAAGIVGKELWCVLNVDAPFKRGARSYIIAFPMPELE